MKNFSNAQRAEVLTQALPHIKRYNDKVVVVKYGGNSMLNEQLKQQVMQDIVLLWLIGIKVVLVLRVTDKESVDIVQMVLAGKVNKTLVNMLEMKGGKAMGISGMDGRLIEAEVKDERLGYVGSITKINIEPVTDLLEKGYIPVVSTVGCDEDGNTYNINGDTAAAYIAGALNAERLIMMTDIAGVLQDKDDPDTLIPEIPVSKIEKLYKDGVVTGGMIPKVECCVKAIEAGVKNVVIMDGRVPHSILMELLTDEGAGTMVIGEKHESVD